METDRTGAPTRVTREGDTFTIAVDGLVVGLVEFIDRPGQRVFVHTEVDGAYGGRGLATILIAQALAVTRAEGLRVVSTCSAVTDYLGKHTEFATIVDPAPPTSTGGGRLS